MDKLIILFSVGHSINVTISFSTNHQKNNHKFVSAQPHKDWVSLQTLPHKVYWKSIHFHFFCKSLLRIFSGVNRWQTNLGVSGWNFLSQLRNIESLNYDIFWRLPPVDQFGQTAAVYLWSSRGVLFGDVRKGCGEILCDVLWCLAYRFIVGVEELKKSWKLFGVRYFIDFQKMEFLLYRNMKNNCICSLVYIDYEKSKLK